MAVVANKYSTSLKTVFSAGVDPDTGKNTERVKSFSNIRDSATDEDIYAVALALAGLQSHPVTAVRKVVTYELTSE